MYRRLGRTAEARSSYEKGLALTQQETVAAIPARADSAVEIEFLATDVFFACALGDSGGASTIECRMELWERSRGADATIIFPKDTSGDLLILRARINLSHFGNST